MPDSPRWDVDRQEAFGLANEGEPWVVVCRHGCFMAFDRKADAVSYRASLWEARRARDEGYLNELCASCAKEVS